ncbi:HEAT repeat domain-containing protein [Anaeromyxobacter sp. Fw109-5]|uniref:HEAT repeat domain-containing protein n=1 Tax=Anaeromyxobacter sp. (strain Fw109-5) TaxID=404589 RepID=UPI001F1A222C|nr:HEAT repeat domain-containing protein [Anaeromyxobacter sp. Fw109-5]
MDGVEGARTIVEPEEFLRSALEKIVFFECRVSQLEAELAAARTTAERARGDAAQARRREVELEQALAAERGQRGDAEARVDEVEERVRLLQAERERLLGGLVERARLSGATGCDGAPGPEEGGADLAGFIAELRAEIESLRAWKVAAEAAGLGDPARSAEAPAHGGVRAERPSSQRHGHDAGAGPESVAMVADRFASDGRVGLTARDNDHMKALLATRADRALYERSMDDLSAPDAGRRLRAVRALEALGSKAAAPLLAAALGREPEAEVKAALLGALARFKEPFAAELAVRALEDGRPAVRVAALEAIVAVASGSAQERLSAALRDPSPLVRRRAALLLGFATGDRAEEALAAALADPDRGVARAAAAALSGRPTARAQGALARGLEHPDASVRRSAATALGRLAGETVDSDAPASARRAASRRIAEKLAAMGGEEIRAAVLAAAPGAPATPLVVRQAHHERPRESARPDPSAGSGKGRAIATASPAALLSRAAVAVVEVAPAPGEDLSAGIVFEVRAALRGCTAADLSNVLGAEPGRVDAALAALAGRGTLVQRGARWFMA